MITLVDLKGNLIASNSKNYIGLKVEKDKLSKFNYKNTKWFIDCFNKKYLEDSNFSIKEVVYEDANFSSILETAYGHKIFGFSYSKFVKDERGNPIYILTLHSNFNSIEELMTSTYEYYIKDGTKSLEISIANKDNYLISDYYPSSLEGKKNFVRDDNIINKYNLAESGDIVTQKLSSGEEGVIEAPHTRLNFMQIKAFKSMRGDKITDGIGWKLIVRVEKRSYRRFYIASNSPNFYISCFCFSRFII